MAASQLSGRIMPMGQITRTISPAIDAIRNAMDDSPQKRIEGGMVYPNGAERLNHRFAKNEPLIGANKDIMHAVGRPQETAIPSLNGLDLSPYASIEEAQRSYHFVGLNKTDFDPLDPNAPKNGLAVIGAGTTGLPWTNPTETAYPGDRIVWSFPSLSRTTNYTSEGKPQNKILPEFGVLKMDDMYHLEKRFVELALKPKSEGGVADASFYDDANLSSEKQGALLLKKHALASAMFIIHGLVKKGVLKIMTPEAAEREANAVKAAVNDNALRTVLGLKATDAADGTYTDALVENNPMNNVAGIIAPKYAIPQNPNGVNVKGLIKEVEENQDRALLWLSAALGVVPLRTVERSLGLQHTVLTHLYPNSYFFSSVFKGAVSMAPKLNSEYWAKGTQSEYGRRIATKYAMAARDFQILNRLILAEETNEVYRREIGTALCIARPGVHGEQLDINLRF